MDRVFYEEHDTLEFCPSFKPGIKWLTVQRKGLSFMKLNANVVAHYTSSLHVSNCFLWHRQNCDKGRCIIKVNSPMH